MEILNRSRSTLKGKISRIETFIKSANEETDSVETKVKLKNVIALQRNIEELRNHYYSIPNVKDVELASIDELNLLEARLEKLEESEFGWIACGKLKERQIDKQGQCFLLNNDSIQDTLKLFFDLEGLGIRDDPVVHERDQVMEIFKETVEFENGRYVVQLPFRKSYNELSDNYSLAK
ncbi:DUF1758 domain-containing protein [Nephila pilipes]|uniref:DUF1758 domain-containing protein n=1 Tax=Nephila pilipes TaxID=299642 RepID=A0A8X6M501_NEPPI|nr:DUF1758 domain-containing protein [Nephila pilipes]